MNTMRHTRALLLALTAAACTSAAVYAAPSAAEVDSAIQQAEAARQKAASVNGEWRDTKALIADAKAALAKGDLDAAAKLAAEAEFQGRQGYEQATAQGGLDFPAFMR